MGPVQLVCGVEMILFAQVKLLTINENYKTRCKKHFSNVKSWKDTRKIKNVKKDDTNGLPYHNDAMTSVPNIIQQLVH